MLQISTNYLVNLKTIRRHLHYLFDSFFRVLGTMDPGTPSARLNAHPTESHVTAAHARKIPRPASLRDSKHVEDATESRRSMNTMIDWPCWFRAVTRTKPGKQTEGNCPAARHGESIKKYYHLPTSTECRLSVAPAFVTLDYVSLHKAVVGWTIAGWIKHNWHRICNVSH